MIVLFLWTRTVYLCHRRADNAELIMKQILLEDMNASDRESAMKEVRILDKLKHPNIIRLFDSFIHGAALCIIMEYAEGTLYRGYIIEEFSQVYSQICFGFSNFYVILKES